MVYVWAANDIVFHTEIGIPYINDDIVDTSSGCDWDAVSREMLEKLNMEHNQFNASWIKKEFIKKVSINFHISNYTVNHYLSLIQRWLDKSE